MVDFPWPDRSLSPNARKHWSVVAKRKRAQKEDWHVLARSGKMPIGNRLSITFHPPDKKPRDLDNMLASIKAGLDGLAAYMGIDDRLFEISITRGAPTKGGLVRVEILSEAGGT